MGPRSNQSCNEMGLDFGILYLSQLGPDLTKTDGTNQVGRRSRVSLWYKFRGGGELA